MNRNLREHLIAAACMIPVGIILAICLFFPDGLAH